MSTLTGKGIEKCLNRERDQLVVTPLLSKKQIGGASIDVRLGNQFIAFKSHRFGIFEPFGKRSYDPRVIQERQIMRFGEPFVLHPGVLILGATFEYVSIPSDIECQLEGRSSWARLGLQVATASSVEPGFKGVITLELTNVGTVPLTLIPGLRIAQLVFHEASPPVENAYSGEKKYRCPTAPQFSRIHEDYDWVVFKTE